MGPATGRGAGFCGGADAPGYASGGGFRGPGAGFGRGRGFWRSAGGRGWRNWFHATGQPGWARFGFTNAVRPGIDANSEKQALQNEADILEAQLNMVKQRLTDLEKSE